MNIQDKHWNFYYLIIMRNINKVIDKVYNDLLTMSDDEFQLELSKYRNGDISKI
jgi:hypothetical protein